MPELLCPVCGRELAQTEKTYLCPGGHSFDRAKSGYVNLLIARQSAAQHGDDKGMVRARRDFLERGHYAPLREALQALAVSCAPPARADVLDAGCGECYYTAAVEQALLESGRETSVVGVEISEDGGRFGDKRGRALRLAVASAYRLPVADVSCDLVLNVFAPFAGGEYRRVLRCGGAVLHVSPGERHLWELKEAVYERPYLNDAPAPVQEGLEPAGEQRLAYPIALNSNREIVDLFCMTPYVHKTGSGDMARLQALHSLGVTAEFILRVYRKA